jgi:hypothetical protein
MTASSIQQAYNPGLLGNVNLNQTGILFIFDLSSDLTPLKFIKNIFIHPSCLKLKHKKEKKVLYN